jgi:hypothetical protein
VGEARPHISASFGEVGSGVALDQVIVRLDGAPVIPTQLSDEGFTFTPTSDLAERVGSAYHWVEVTLPDRAGHETTTQWQFHVDLHTWVEVDSPPDGAQLSTLATPVAGSAEANAALTLTVNGGLAATTTVRSDGGFDVQNVALVSGTNVLVAHVADGVGNRDTATATITVDTSRPGVAALALIDPFSPDGNGYRDTTTFELLATPPATDTVASWRLEIGGGGDPLRRFDGTCPLTDTWRLSWDGRDDGGQVLADGAYTYTLAVTTTGGLTNTSTPATVRIDTSDPAPPVITDPQAGAVYTATAYIPVQGAADPGSLVTLFNGLNFTHTVQLAPGQTAWQYDGFGLNLGPNVLRAIATDGAGNESLPSLPVTVTHYITPPLYRGAIVPGMVTSGTLVSLQVLARGNKPNEGPPTLAAWATMPTTPTATTLDLQETSSGAPLTSTWEMTWTAPANVERGYPVAILGARDSAGQWEEDEVAFEVNMTRPHPPLITPLPPRYANTVTLTIEGKTDDTWRTVTLYVRHAALEDTYTTQSAARATGASRAWRCTRGRTSCGPPAPTCSATSRNPRPR